MIKNSLSSIFSKPGAIHKNILKSFILIAFIVCRTGSLVAVGSFTVGVYTGISPSMNDIGETFPQEGGNLANGEPIADRGRRDFQSLQNHLTQNAIADGATGSPFGSPMGIHLGVDFRYNLNALFFRAALDYETLIFGRTASLQTANHNNAAEITSFSSNIPITIGINHAIKDFIQVNIGVGPYLSYSSLTVTHSAPNAFTETLLGVGQPGLVPYKSQAMSGFLFGYHALIGLQVPIVEKKYYLSIDFMAFRARSFSLPVTATDANDNPVTDIRDRLTRTGATVSVGIQYLIGM